MKQIEFVKNRITELREDKRMSERELSHRVDKSDNYIGGMMDLRKPDSAPSMKMFFKICAVLGVTPHAFFDEDNPYPIQTEEIVKQILRLTGADKELLALTLSTLERMEPTLFCELLVFCNRPQGPTA